MNQSFFEKKIKPILLYIGTIGAIAMSIGYIILMFVLVIGFKASANMKSAITFAIVNAIVGFVIMQFLKIQGIDFAKQLSKNMEITDRYNVIIAKTDNDKDNGKKARYHTMNHFWVKTVITDILGKALTVGVTTAGIIYIVIEGSQDYNMLLLSVVNLILFGCFGLVSLVKAYDFYNEKYIPYVQEQVNKYEKDKKEEKQKKGEEDNLAMVQGQSSKQRDTDIHSDRGSNLLDTSLDTSVDSTNNTESMVVDSNNIGNSVLGRSIYTSSSTSDSIDTGTEKVV